MRVCSLRSLVLWLILSLWTIFCPSTQAKLDDAISDCESGANHECLKGEGFDIIKDYCGPTQLLLVATEEPRLTGIEDPRASSAGARNYFLLAWQVGALHLLRKIVAPKTLEHDEIGLAMNSADRRADEILHIHIDLLRPAVTKALREHEKKFPFEIRFSEQEPSYTVTHSPDLEANVLTELRKKVPGADSHAKKMSHYTLVVVGDKSGFFVLHSRTNGLVKAHGEDLLVDHTGSDSEGNPACKPGINRWGVSKEFQ